MRLKTIYDIKAAVTALILTESTLQVLVDSSEDNEAGDLSTWRWEDYAAIEKIPDMFELFSFAQEKGYAKPLIKAAYFLSFIKTVRYSQRVIEAFFENLPKVNYNARELAAGVQKLGTDTPYDTVRYIADRCHISSDEAKAMRVEEIMLIILSDRKKAIYERALQSQK